MKRVKRMLSHYDQLIARLRRKENGPVVADLKKRISRIDFKKVTDYFTNKINPNIASMKPKEALRLKKGVTKLPRSLSVLRSEEGLFEVYLSTKSRMANNVRERKVSGESAGASKKGKSAWRIDLEKEEEYFELVAKPAISINREVLFSQQFPSRYIHKSKLGPTYINKKSKISIYSLKADCNFRDYLNAFRTELLPIEKEEIVLHLLKAIKVLHDKGYVHQDIKPENILVFSEEGYLALTDFGNHQKIGEKVRLFGTPAYDSPEIAYWISEKEKQVDRPFLAYEYLEKYLADTKKYNIDREAREQFQFSHPANDMWALGVTIFEIFYGRLPTLEDRDRIKVDPLLKGLLAPDWRDRLTIDETIAVHEKMKCLREEEEQMEPRVKRKRARL